MRSPQPWLAVLVVLGACAPATTSGPTNTPTTTTATAPRIVENAPVFQSEGKDTEFRLSPDDTPSSRGVRGAPQQVWAALPVVYGVLGMEPDLVDPDRLTVGSTRLTVSRIDGKRISAYVRCGGDGSGIELASQRRYRLNVVTSLRPEGSGTVVSTRVEGSATPVDGGGGATYCASNGMLEARIVELIQARTGR